MVDEEFPPNPKLILFFMALTYFAACVPSITVARSPSQFEVPPASSILPTTPTPRSPPKTERPRSDGGITDPGIVLTPAALPFPAYNTIIIEPVFGTSIRRITNAIESDSFGTHIYSQLQAFSPDGKYVLLIEGEYTIRRLVDLTNMGLTTEPWNAPRWQSALPHSVVHYDSNDDTTLRVQYTDVETGLTEIMFTFPLQYQRIRGNQSFDELSRQGRWMGGMASLSNGKQAIFALDLQNLTLGAQFTVSGLYSGPCAPDPEWGKVEPDWIGISPLGNYLVVQWKRDGTERCSGLETFDLITGNFIGRAYDGHQHGDLGLLSDGISEVFVTFELYHPSGNLAIAYRELPGTESVSAPVYIQVLDWLGEHISCQGPSGVCLITTWSEPSDGWSALEGEVYLLNMDGTVLRLAHHRSSICGYWIQPRGSISRDGQHVIFASDWGLETGESSCDQNHELGAGEAYLIDLEPEMPIIKYLSYLGLVVKQY